VNSLTISIAFPSYKKFICWWYSFIFGFCIRSTITTKYFLWVMSHLET
jgi:hypothetical protein